MISNDQLLKATKTSGSVTKNNQGQPEGLCCNNNNYFCDILPLLFTSKSTVEIDYSNNAQDPNDFLITCMKTATEKKWSIVRMNEHTGFNKVNVYDFFRDKKIETLQTGCTGVLIISGNSESSYRCDYAKKNHLM